MSVLIQKKKTRAMIATTDNLTQKRPRKDKMSKFVLHKSPISHDGKYCRRVDASCGTSNTDEDKQTLVKSVI